MVKTISRPRCQQLEQKCARLRTILATANTKLAQEISERTQAEAALREQRDELAQLYETSPLGLGVVDRDLRFVRISQRLAAIHGVPAADNIGRAVHDVVLEPLASGVAAPFRQVINSGEPLLDIEMTGPTATTVGKDHHWLTNDYPLTAPDGTVRGASVIVQAITERKEAAEALRQAYDDLEILVGERTAALTQAIGRLTAEMTVRKHAEQQLAASLREKETLLREAHDRGKHNKLTDAQAEELVVAA